MPWAKALRAKNEASVRKAGSALGPGQSIVSSSVRDKECVRKQMREQMEGEKKERVWCHIMIIEHELLRCRG